MRLVKSKLQLVLIHVSMTNVRRVSPASDSHTHIAQIKLAHMQIHEG